MADTDNNSNGTMAAGVPDAAENFTRAWQAAESEANELEKTIISKAGEAAATLRGAGQLPSEDASDEEKAGDSDESTEKDQGDEAAEEGAKDAGEDAAEAKEKGEGEEDKQKKADEAESKDKKAKPTPKEWAAIRAAKRRAKQDIDSYRQRAEAELQQKYQELQQREQSIAGQKTSAQLQEMRERGDYDAIAEAIGAKDWNELVGDAVKDMHSPAFKEVLAMRKREREREAEEQAKKQQAAQAEQTRRQQEAAQVQHQQQQQHIKEMAEELALREATTDDERQIATLAKTDPRFMGLVFQIRKEEWDGFETISVEEAAERALKAAREQYDHLRKIFGDQASVEKPEGESQPGQRGSKSAAKPSKQIPRNKVREAKTPEKELSEAEWQAMAKREMEKVAALERAGA